MSYSSNKRNRDDDDRDSSKRQRTENPPSCVLHVRGLPNYCTEQELTQLCSPCGPVTRVLLLKQNQQAFVQMATIESAIMVMQRYNSMPATIQNRSVYFQYSNRTEITGGHNNEKNHHHNDGGKMDSSDSSQQAGPILIVSVLNVRVPVTLENIHQIFKPYGDVLKIITFAKNNVFKALVQMGSTESAMNAKLLLEGKDIFQGCCHLRIGFSNLSELRVTANGPRARDFTQSDTSFNSFSFNSNSNNGFNDTLMRNSMITPPMMQGFNGFGNFGGMTSQEKGCVILVNNLPDTKISCDVLFTLFGVYGDVMRVKILFNKRDSAMIQYASPQQAYLACLHLNHLVLFDKEINVSPSKHMEVALPRSGDTDPDSAMLTKDYSNSPIHRFRKRGGPIGKNINPPSAVLHVNSIPESTSEEELRQVFASESTPRPAVQFFVNNRTQAFIRMDSIHDAVVALIRLHNYKMGERYLRVSFSPKDPTQIQDSDGPNAPTTSSSSSDRRHHDDDEDDEHSHSRDRDSNRDRRRDSKERSTSKDRRDRRDDRKRDSPRDEDGDGRDGNQSGSDRD